MTPLRVNEAERQRLLQVMGFEVWVRRGSEPMRTKRPLPTAKPDSVQVTQRARAPAADPRRGNAPSAAIAAASLPGAQPPSSAPPSARPRAPAAVPRMSAQSVLLVLDKRLHADAQLVRHLMLALPGCTICTADTLARGTAKFALQLGVDASLPADVLGVRAPTLDALRLSASARRSLWWSIKPLLKALRG